MTLHSGMIPPSTRRLVSETESQNSRVSCASCAASHILAGQTPRAIPLSVGTPVLPRTASTSVAVPSAPLSAKLAPMASQSSLSPSPRMSRSHLCTGSRPPLLHKHKHSRPQGILPWATPRHPHLVSTTRIHRTRRTTAASGAIRTRRIHTTIHSTSTIHNTTHTTVRVGRALRWCRSGTSCRTPSRRWATTTPILHIRATRVIRTRARVPSTREYPS